MDLLELNPQFLFGAAGLIGAGVRGYLAYREAKKKKASLKFDVSVYSDTLIEGVAVGIAASVGLPISYAAMGFVALAGVGLDSYTNKLGLKLMPFLRDLVVKVNQKKKK